MDATEPVATDNPEAQTAASALNAELVQTRLVLNADQLCSLVAPRARLERSFDRLSAYFFTIDGVLNGSKVTGALFAGECMLVFALSERSAQERANAGLRQTVELLQEEYRYRDILGTGATGKGLDVGSGGRRARPSEAGRELAANPRLKAIIASEIGGLPWKG